MPETALLISVHLLDPRYHGSGDWPPAPFRLFQALVAGALHGMPADHADTVAPAFAWLESLPPPVIAVPPARTGQDVLSWVPTNDRDASDQTRESLAKQRTGKHSRPRILERHAPLLYLWRLPADAPAPPADLPAIAERLYQLGRGIDMACARAEVLPLDAAEARLEAHGGTVHRPAEGGGDGALACPIPGAYASLRARHRARGARQSAGALKQAPPPRSRMVSYDAPPVRVLFDLMADDGSQTFRPRALTDAATVVEAVRDRLAAALRLHRDDNDGDRIDRLIVGRGAGRAEIAQRPRLIPLPSIGMRHADHAIRRVLLEIPPDCPIRADEIAWAAGTVHLGATLDGEVTEDRAARLVRATDTGMQRHYGIGTEARRVWRSVTPIALPDPAARRPGRKSGGARTDEEAVAAAALRQALRHAGVPAPARSVRLQREPFTRHGARADAFAAGTRFAARRLWHAEITFAAPVTGPLVLGDGRYLGLGVMAPAPDAHTATVLFRVTSDQPLPVAAAPDLVKAVRRALMALAADGRGRIRPLFSGHQPDGAPNRPGHHAHVFLSAADTDGDGTLDTVMIAAPWACDPSIGRQHQDRALFDRVVGRLSRVRAGRLGVLDLMPAPPDGAAEVLTAPGRVWRSHTPYRPTRHPHRRDDTPEALRRDVLAECARRGLPQPEVHIGAIGTTGGTPGLTAHLDLRFAVAVPGPLLLGRDSHKGGGLFVRDG